MANINDPDLGLNHEGQPSTSKRPYQKPSFRFEKVFVTTALSCGKTEASIEGACHITPKVS